MTQPGLERSFHAIAICPGPTYVHTVYGLALTSLELTATFAALCATVPYDYLVKASGRADVTIDLASHFPLPQVDPGWLSCLLQRWARLNCLTIDYADLWRDLHDSTWTNDRWTDPQFGRVSLGDVPPTWTITTPLRRDFDRRLALVELDALAALILGLTAEQLCAMYRTQFAVLRKYEYKMAFDAEGRKICSYHQSAGYRQTRVQEQAKAGDLPKKWSNVWNLFEDYENDPSSVDWLGHYTPPFYRPDREKEMTHAHEEFKRRLDDGEYG